MEHSRASAHLSNVLSAQSIMNNPYPAFHCLREYGSLHWDEEAGIGLITSYQNSVALLRDRRFAAQISVDSMLQTPADGLAPYRETIETMEQIILLQENTDHTRLRTLFSTVFSAHSVEMLCPRIQATADLLLDALLQQKQMELIEDFAYPFAGGVLATIMGVPEEDQKQVIEWSRNIERLLVESPHPLDTTLRWTAEMASFTSFFHRLLEKRLAKAEKDFFQSILVACKQENTLSEDELVSNFVFLLFAGIPPAAQMLAKAFSLLLRHPDQLQLITENPALLTPALEELLRFDGPIVSAQRFAKEDLQLHERPIRTGQCVMVCLSAANRDPAQFADPDCLDIRREKKQHLAFGHGTRFCLGALLARTIIHIGLETLLRRLSRPLLIKEEPDPVRMTRYLKTLTIAYD